MDNRALQGENKELKKKEAKDERYQLTKLRQLWKLAILIQKLTKALSGA